jgi:hypothetical protein
MQPGSVATQAHTHYYQRKKNSSTLEIGELKNVTARCGIPKDNHEGTTRTSINSLYTTV